MSQLLTLDQIQSHLLGKNALGLTLKYISRLPGVNYNNPRAIMSYQLRNDGG